MRVYISVDMEGVAGVVHEDQTNPTDPRCAPEYARFRRLMTAEANAAIQGAVDAAQSADREAARSGRAVLRGTQATLDDGGDRRRLRRRAVYRVPRARGDARRDPRPYLHRPADRRPPERPFRGRAGADRRSRRRVRRPGGA